jgi:toxin ParE1/3/4
MAADPVFRIVAAARAELVDIAEYSESQWGRDQSERYLHQLYERFDFPARNPGAGSRREQFGVGVRLFPTGRHLIFYRSVPEGILVLGIAGAGMDIDRYFGTDS